MTARTPVRSGPGPFVRALGRAINSTVVRFPWSWRFFRRPVRRFFGSRAVGWDDRVQSGSPGYLEPLVAALGRMGASPARVLDIGTGMGAAALELADRYPAAEVVGIDLSEEMIAQAETKAAALSGRVRFLVADITSFEQESGFDLIVMLNMPPFFENVVALLNPRGYVVHASSYGSRTPFFTPPELLKRGFEGQGLRTLGQGHAALGTYYVARQVQARDEDTAMSGPRMFPTYRYRDIEGAITFLVEAFGFIIEGIARDERGRVLRAALAFGDGLILLGRHQPDWTESRIPDDIGGVTGTMYLIVDDVKAHFERATHAGAQIARALETTDDGSLEYSAWDTEGQLWHFGTVTPQDSRSLAVPRVERGPSMRVM